MRIAVFGDILGKSGRKAVATHLPRLREALSLDFVAINAENAAGGFGITRGTAEELFDSGADVLTLGNHSWDQSEALTYIEREPRLLRPVNYPPNTAPGKGANLFHTRDGQSVLVMNVMGRLFMDPLDDPFAAVDKELSDAPLREVADAILIDFHGEATSEKNAMGYFCDGRASLVVGTHTHVPTADARILPAGTGYITDLGMTGDYNSIIGMDTEEPLRRFTTKMRSGRFQPAEGEATLCGVFIETDDKTGLATRIEPIRVGGGLAQAIPGC